MPNESQRRRSAAERSSAARELVRRDGVLEERPQARDDCDRGLSRREPPERQEALVHRGPRRGGGFERHRLALRKREDPLLAEPARKLGTPAACAVLARRHECDDARVLSDERGPREGTRSGSRVRNDDALPILEPRGKGAVRLAPVGELENSA